MKKALRVATVVVAGVIFSWAVGKTIEQAVQPSNNAGFTFSSDQFHDRVAHSDSSFCLEDVVPQKIIDARQYISTARKAYAESDKSSGGAAAASTVYVCNATLEDNLSFKLNEDADDLQAYYYLKTTNELPQWYWVFIFSNQNDITSEVLGNKNLFKLNPDEEIVISHTYAKPVETAIVLSVLTINVNALAGPFGGESFHTSVRIDTEGTYLSDMEIQHALPGIASPIAPYPDVASYAIKDSTVQFVFSELEDGERETIDFSLFDLQKGITRVLMQP